VRWPGLALCLFLWHAQCSGQRYRWCTLNADEGKWETRIIRNHRRGTTKEGMRLNRRMLFGRKGTEVKHKMVKGDDSWQFHTRRRKRLALHKQERSWLNINGQRRGANEGISARIERPKRDSEHPRSLPSASASAASSSAPRPKRYQKSTPEGPKKSAPPMVDPPGTWPPGMMALEAEEISEASLGP